MSIVGFLAKLRVRTKIIGVIAVMGLMVLGGVYFAAGRMRQIDDNYSKFLDRDAVSWVNATRVAKNIIEARYFMLRMADAALSMENKKSIAPRVMDGLDDAQKFAKSVKDQSPEYATAADAIAGRIGQLRQTAAQVTSMSLGMKDVEAKELLAEARPVFDQLSADADKLRTDIEKSIKIGSEGLTDTTNATINLTWTVMGSIVAGGVLLGFLVALFGIASPLTALVEVLQKMAKGEDLEVVGADRKDEIGDTARAVTAIRIMIAEKAQREAVEKADRDLKESAAKAERDRLAAEQKAEADKLAAAEREAATAKVMAEFDAAVGGIAKAAMAGDFSQRVSLEGKEGVIRNLAGAMNLMCDNIGQVMDDLVAMMAALAEGDLTKRIDADYEGTFGVLKDSANTTAVRLSETVSEITASAKEVANAAAEISTSTTDLSQRTEEQAAGLEETSASMEEIGATVRKNAENAQQANQLTAGAREVADRGGAVVASTVDAMSRIEDSSRKIADIIGVIDEIARQTNLLALNAAVEAARAGDAGRGFAVVASEVRSLAQRSSQAAKDIKDLITSSSTQVKDGVDLVNRTGASLNEIVASIKSVADIVADIAMASNEQATGIDQVNKALTQMDEVTQQNSALVEENAATAKTLESQSAAMSERVSFFRIDQGLQNAARAPIVRPASVKSAAARRGGPVGRMQAGLATALKRDNFEEF
jgi:methyl-accepting chemotaxis protein